MNDNRQKRLSEALRANLKRRKQQLRGRADQAERTTQQPREAAADDDNAAPLRDEDKGR